MSDCDLTRLMTRFHSSEEEVQKLRSALANLKRWTGEWVRGEGCCEEGWVEVRSGVIGLVSLTDIKPVTAGAL